jgi:hydrophobic surface binding protein A
MYLLPLFSLFVFVLADFNTFQDVYSFVTDAMGNFDQTIMRITQESPNIRALTPATTAVLEAFNSGTKILAGTPALELSDMSLFMVTSSTLLNAVTVTITDLESKKDVIESATAKSIVLQALTKIKDATQTFLDVVFSKIPEDTKDLLKDQENDVIGGLNRGMAIFNLKG